MADILREITAWTLILTGLATCLSAGAALAALLMHITTQWLWEKLKGKRQRSTVLTLIYW